LLPNAAGIKNHHSLIRNKVHCKVYSPVLNTNTMVCRHFGPKTLRTQDISAPCVCCRSVSNFCVGAEVSKSAWDTSDPELKDAYNIAIVLRNVVQLYVRYSNVMDRVLGKRLTKAVSPSGSITYVWTVTHCLQDCNEHNRRESREMQLQWAEIKRR